MAQRGVIPKQRRGIGAVQRRRRRALGIAIGLLATASAGSSLAGAAGPSLQDRIDSARADAAELSDRVDAKSGQISEAEARAREAGARAMETGAELERARERSAQLAGELRRAEEELAAVRARYVRAVGVLSDRLVEIYKGSEPDALSVILEADGLEDLETRSEYLQALRDADTRIAGRVASLRDEVRGRFDEVAGIKEGIDAEAARLSASRAEFASARDAAEREAASLSDARAGVQADLGEVTDRVAELESEQAARRQQSSAGSGGSLYAGGPYAIPTYIVMCESGGNYRALNPSSGAGGAYQIIPSTWAAYGGSGLPQNAPKAEQDRIAGLIWADVGASAWSCA